MAYRLGRTVGVDGLYSDLVTPVCGITAGSGFACTELRVMLLDVPDDLMKANPMADLRLIVYVDDMTIQYEHVLKPVTAHVVARVTDQAMDGLEDLGAKVSAPKSLVNASSWTLARAVTRLIRKKKLTPARVCKLLGTGLLAAAVAPQPL